MKRGVKKKVELQNPEPRKFFRISELAMRWAVSESTIRRMIAANEIPVKRFGSSVRISFDDILRHEEAVSG